MSRRGFLGSIVGMTETFSTFVFITQKITTKFKWKIENFNEAVRKCCGTKKHFINMLGMFIFKNGGHMVAQRLKVVKLNIYFRFKRVLLRAKLLII